MKILVTGANGQLGQELQDIANQYLDYEWLFHDKDGLDICDKTAVQNVFERFQPNYCINAAAYTAVDKAEEDEITAYNVNVKAVQYLAAASKQYDTKLIHLSTDYVYHNAEQNTPYIETDVTNPQGVYARTKLEGEQEGMKILDSMLTIRTSWVYSSYGHNFVKTMLRLGTSRPSLGVIYDQIGTPTYAADLAVAIMSIITSKQWESGTYHYSNEGICSWYDFAKAIFDIKSMTCQVNPIPTTAYPTPAKRPHFSVMSKEKIKNTFQLKIPYWRTALERCLQRLEAETKETNK